MCKRCRCTYKLYIDVLRTFIQLCFQSDTIVVSRWQSPHCLCWLYKKSSSSYKRIKNAKQFIELWTNPKHTGDNALVQSKDTKTIYINSIRIILKYTANICFLEMGIFCCNSADGFHGIATCESVQWEIWNLFFNCKVSFSMCVSRLDCPVCLATQLYATDSHVAIPWNHM
jgi:hypothetical protein